MQVKIYDKTLNPLTTLLLEDVESVEHTSTKEGDGKATFTLRTDSSKINSTKLRMYNKVKIFEGSTCKFFGFISDIQVNLNTVTVNCFAIGLLLKNRVLGGSYAVSGTISAILTSMLTTVNSADPTGISLGTVDPSLVTTYSKTYTGGNDFDYIVNDLLGDAVQWRVDEAGLIQVAPMLGNDLSATVKLRYDITQVESANITGFNVKESGQSIATSIIAKRTGGTVTVTDPALIALYGLVETTKSYTYVTTNPDLTAKATLDLKGSTFSPEITLSPRIVDNFNVCDILGVRLYNGIIDIATAYQIIEKTVSYIGGEKKISVKLNEKEKGTIDIFLDMKKRIKLLENI